MAHIPHELPADVEALRLLVIAQQEQLAERDAAIAKLEHTVRQYARWLWGPRTEKRVSEQEPAAGQPYLPFADLLVAAQRLADEQGARGSVELKLPSEPPPKARAKRRSEFPSHLPCVRTTIEVAEEDRVCCGQPMEPMGVELSKKLERVETAVVHEIARTKYCCRKCQMQVLTAPAPVHPLPKALLGPTWLASLAVERFGNHMPYYRLEKKYLTEGLELSRTVLCRSMIELARAFEPVYEALGDEVVQSDVAFADETSAKAQRSKSGGPGKSWVWLYANKDGDCFYDYCESRGRDSPTRRLKGFKGSLHDDGYCVYEVALDPERVTHVACWAHVRRKFDESLSSDRVLAQEALDWIAELYAIDKAAKAQGLSSDQLGALRREHAPPILAGFKEWLGIRQTQVVPKSPMGRAIGYALGRWEALCRFVEDGRFELDNNRAERALRAVAVGRKNWVQFGNENGGRTAATMLSLISTCKVRGINPKLYIDDAAVLLAQGVDPKTLTPREWQARYGEQAAERRSYVLAQILGKLPSS